MALNFKKLRKYSLILVIILYLGIIIFEAIFNFNQGVLSKLFSNYETLAQPLYVLVVLIAIMTGLISAAVVFSGFFIFNLSTIIILTSIGIILGIPLIFIISRKIGHKAFKEYINLNEDRAKKLKEISKNDSTALVILFNFIFFLPSTFGGIVGGLAESKLTKLIILSTIGNLINQIAFILLIFGIQTITPIYIAIPLLVLILNTGIPILIYRKNIRDVLKITFSRKQA